MVAQLVKNLPAMWETWVQSLGGEDPLEKGKATHSSIQAWRIPWTVQPVGSQRVEHDSVTFTFRVTLRSKTYRVSSVQFSSVAQSRPTPCHPMNRSTLGLPVHHQLLEFTQTHIHQVSDAIQPSHPLSSPSPPAPNPSQHQSLFQRVNSSHEVAKVLEFQLQHHSFQRNPRAPSEWTGWISLQSKGLSRVLSNTTDIQSAAAATAAKSLQLCLTLCDPIDGSPPGSAIPGILQARTLEWVAISFSNA